MDHTAERENGLTMSSGMKWTSEFTPLTIQRAMLGRNGGRTGC